MADYARLSRVKWCGSSVGWKGESKADGQQSAFKPLPLDLQFSKSLQSTRGADERKSERVAKPINADGLHIVRNNLLNAVVKRGRLVRLADLGRVSAFAKL